MSSLAAILINSVASAGLAGQEGLRIGRLSANATSGPLPNSLDGGIFNNLKQRQAESSGGFSLSSFATEIHTKSILDVSRHLMMFTLPKGLLEVYDPNDVKQVILRGDASTLPGIAFAESEEIRRYGMGPTEKFPYLPIFGAISASYIVDGSGVIHKFFTDWMSYIVGFNSSDGMTTADSFGKNPYEVSYKDDYSATASVFVYNEQNDKIVEIRMSGAYPIAINAIPMNWSNTDQVMRLDVTWDYRDWKVIYHLPTPGSSAGINNLIGRFAQLTGSETPNLNLRSLITGGAIPQRISDIRNLIGGSSQTIVNSIRSRIGF